MADRSPGAHVARRRLGAALRKLREDANIRLDAAARELECSSAKISRLENGLGPAKLWDVRILLSFYGANDAATRNRLERWAGQTKEPSWWEADSDLTNDDGDLHYAAETEAALVRMFGTPVIPALLQSEEYAGAHIHVMFPDWPTSDVRRFAAMRLARQESLRRPADPLGIDAVIDEAALMRRVGTRDTHLHQLTFLGELIDEFASRPDFSVRVLPLVAGPTRLLAPLTIFEPRNPALDERTAHIEESATSGTWLAPDDVELISSVFDEVVAMSLPTAESRARIEAIRSSL
jgi:hypothetical protein